MLKTLPESTFTYVLEQLPPYVGLFVIKADDAGKIVDYFGNYNNYLSREPHVEEAVDQLVPALLGMVPPMINPTVLNRIQTDKESIADIHIVADEETNYWIFFVDQTKEVESIRHLLQGMNEAKLALETDQSSAETINPFCRLDIFGYMTFTRLDENTFERIGKYPDWFVQLEANIDDTRDQIQLADWFPFLEVFLMEANEFWQDTKESVLESGIWVEKTKKGEETLLKAFAVNLEGKAFLMINTLNNSIDVPRETIQRAREQSLAYDKLEKTERKLKELLSYKDKFVSIVSHDLRSPVAAVLGIAEMMCNDDEVMGSLDDFYTEMVQNIRSEMNRLLDYNDKLYHWSNLELGNFELVKTQVDLKALATSAGRVAESKMATKNIKFNLDVPEKLSVFVDETLFSQVLNNLVGNAVKFTPEEGSISIRAIAQDEDVLLKVCDTGVGMPDEVQQKIFAGFSRDSTIGTGGEKGTGLGLGIVKKIVDAHFADIWVESTPGKGSDFVIRIRKDKPTDQTS